MKQFITALLILPLTYYLLTSLSPTSINPPSHIIRPKYLASHQSVIITTNDGIVFVENALRLFEKIYLTDNVTEVQNSILRNKGIMLLKKLDGLLLERVRLNQVDRYEVMVETVVIKNVTQNIQNYNLYDQRISCNNIQHEKLLTQFSHLKQQYPLLTAQLTDIEFLSNLLSSLPHTQKLLYIPESIAAFLQLECVKYDGSIASLKNHQMQGTDGNVQKVDKMLLQNKGRKCGIRLDDRLLISVMRRQKQLNGVESVQEVIQEEEISQDQQVQEQLIQEQSYKPEDQQSQPLVDSQQQQLVVTDDNTEALQSEQEQIQNAQTQNSSQDQVNTPLTIIQTIPQEQISNQSQVQQPVQDQQHTQDQQKQIEEKERVQGQEQQGLQQLLVEPVGQQLMEQVNKPVVKVILQEVPEQMINGDGVELSEVQLNNQQVSFVQKSQEQGDQLQLSVQKTTENNQEIVQQQVQQLVSQQEQPFIPQTVIQQNEEREGDKVVQVANQLGEEIQSTQSVPNSEQSLSQYTQLAQHPHQTQSSHQQQHIDTLVESLSILEQQPTRNQQTKNDLQTTYQQVVNNEELKQQQILENPPVIDNQQIDSIVNNNQVPLEQLNQLIVNTQQLEDKLEEEKLVSQLQNVIDHSIEKVISQELPETIQKKQFIENQQHIAIQHQGGISHQHQQTIIHQQKESSFEQQIQLSQLQIISVNQHINTQTHTLSNEQSDTLPNEQTDTLPNEQFDTLPNEQSDTLPNEQFDTLPNEQLLQSIETSKQNSSQNQLTQPLQQNSSQSSYQRLYPLPRQPFYYQEMMTSTFDQHQVNNNIQFKQTPTKKQSDNQQNHIQMQNLIGKSVLDENHHEQAQTWNENVQVIGQ